MSRNINDNKYEVGKEAKDIDYKDVEIDKKSDLNKSINHILIKPIVKIDVDISELRTVPAG